MAVMLPINYGVRPKQVFPGQIFMGEEPTQKMHLPGAPLLCRYTHIHEARLEMYGRDKNFGLLGTFVKAVKKIITLVLGVSVIKLFYSKF